MPGKEHRYTATITWTGNPGQGTTKRGDHCRDHEIAVEGKPGIAGSSDPGFRGDPARHNPEDLLVASLSACHTCFGISHFVARRASRSWTTSTAPKAR